MKKLEQISIELKKTVEQVKNDKDIADLGFISKGKLCEYEGYENFYERLWVWVKTEGEKVHIVITVDNGNSSCNLVYTDMYISDIVKMC